MKENFWMYSQEGRYLTIRYVIDGWRMTEGEAINYLTMQKDMTDEEAYRYINDLPHH